MVPRKKNGDGQRGLVRGQGCGSRQCKLRARRLPAYLSDPLIVSLVLGLHLEFKLQKRERIQGSADDLR